MYVHLILSYIRCLCSFVFVVHVERILIDLFRTVLQGVVASHPRARAHQAEARRTYRREAGTFQMEASDRTYVFIYYFCKKDSFHSIVFKFSC